jgi:hypothetical protein
MLMLRSLTGRDVHPDPKADAAGVLLRSATAYSTEFGALNIMNFSIFRGRIPYSFRALMYLGRYVAMRRSAKWKASGKLYSSVPRRYTFYIFRIPKLEFPVSCVPDRPKIWTKIGSRNIIT